MGKLGRATVTVAAVWMLVGCGGTGDEAADGGVDAGVVDPYVPVQTAYDDLAVAPKCNPDDDAQNCVEMSEDATRVDDDQRMNWRNVHFDLETKTLSFDLAEGTTLGAKIAQGKVLVRSGRGRPPLMARILAVAQVGQHVELKMGPRLRLHEVFPRGRVRFRAPLGADPSTLSQNQAGLAVVQAGLSLGTVGPTDCSGNVFNQTITGNTSNGNGTGTGTVKLDLTKCKFRLGAYVDVDIQWEGLTLKKAEAVLGGTIDASLHTKLEAVLTASYKSDKKLWELAPPLAFSIGPVPFTIEIELNGGYEVSAKADLTVEQGFDLTGRVEAGAGYRKSGSPQIYSVYERDSSFTSYGPLVTFDGNVTAKAFVKPRVSVQALGFAGVTASVKCFAEGKITAHATAGVDGGSASAGAEVCANLYAGITPTVAMVLDPDIPLFEPLEKEYELTTFKTLIKENVCVGANVTYPTNCDATSGCCVDSQCPDDSMGFDVKCVKGNATTGGKYLYACQTQYPEDFCLKASDCKDGKALTVDQCVDHYCSNPLLNLKATAEDLAGAVGVPDAGVVTIPSKCYTNSDCDDGKVLTRDTCTKTAPTAGPSIAGHCENKLPAP